MLVLEEEDQLYYAWQNDQELVDVSPLDDHAPEDDIPYEDVALIMDRVQDFLTYSGMWTAPITDVVLAYELPSIFRNTYFVHKGQRYTSEYAAMCTSDMMTITRLSIPPKARKLEMVLHEMSHAATLVGHDRTFLNVMFTLYDMFGVARKEDLINSYNEYIHRQSSEYLLRYLL